MCVCVCICVYSIIDGSVLGFYDSPIFCMQLNIDILWENAAVYPLCPVCGYLECFQLSFSFYGTKLTED